MQYTELQGKSIDELRELAREVDIPDSDALKKQELIFRLLQAQPATQPAPPASQPAGAAGAGSGQTQPDQGLFREGVLEIMDNGNGFLRLDRHWMPGPDDIYVSQTQIRRVGLRTGDLVVGPIRPPKDSGERFYSLLRVDSVNGMDPELAKRRPWFDNLTAVFPDEMFDLELKDTSGSRELAQANISNRVINLFSPMGKGQRGLVVSPPKAGKTMLLKGIAHGITQNYPDVYVMVALIGERPEEVTDWQKTVRQAEVISSTFDEPPENMSRVAEMCLERAKRLVELGKDVVILLDSITRLARAYNYVVPTSGRTLSGGMDPAALYPPKRFIGAARNVEEGGSLTIIATCLVETESRLDDVIFEEFKGTVNMEVRLDRKLQEKRIFPAINAPASSTRREELLLDESTLKQVVTLRRMLAALGNTEDALQAMVHRLTRTSSNQEFLATLKEMV
ncbi:MAG TPA: transcription termination factor Rho [Chloroflexota bacterium]|nr:transcription termination factor Rho [Chloroflexota bacterium]